MGEEFTYFISNEEISNLELKCFSGPIMLIDKASDADAACLELSKEKIIGFDTESKPSFRKGEHHPIALIQLSTEEKAYLFRINKIGFPEPLKEILKDGNISKVGLGISNDTRELNKTAKINAAGFIDLEAIAKKYKFKQRSVRALSAFFMNIRISKSAQKTNWERSDLTEQQIRYAATDAWACLLIYKNMSQRGFVNEQIQQ